MERPGSRCSQYLTVIEKVCNKTNPVGINTKKESSEDVHQLRSATARILQTINSTKSDRNLRESFIKQNGFTILMMALREGIADKQTVENIVFILLELLSKTCAGKSASALISAGATNLFLQLLVTESKESSPKMTFMIHLHQLLAKIGNKDSKFPTKARLSQALPITVNMIKSCAGDFKKMVPLLQILKMYSTNSVNATYLVKQNCVQLMFRLISLCGKSHCSVLKLALEILCNLTKSKSNAVRTVNVDFITSLLHLHSDWHALDSKHKNLTLRKMILIALKNFINTKAGRAAFLVADGVNVMFRITRECLSLRNMDSLVLVSSLILRKCCPIDLLPLDNFDSFVTFDTPVSEMANSPVPCEDVSVKMQPPSLNNEVREKSEAHDKSVTLQLLEEDSSAESNKDLKEETSKDGSKKKEASTDSNQRNEKELSLIYEKFFLEILDKENLENIGDSGAVCQPLMENKVCLDNEALPHDLKATDSEILNKQPSCASIVAGHLQSDCPSTKHRSASPHQLKEIAKEKRSSSLCRKGSVRDKKSSSSESSETALTSLLNITSLSSVPPLDAPPPEIVLPMEISVPPGFPGLRDTMEHDRETYLKFSRQTKSILSFQKVAYPDYIGAKSVPRGEPLHCDKCFVSRENLLYDIDRHLHPEHVINETVYDIDALLSNHMDAGKPTCSQDLVNLDEKIISSTERKKKKGSLKFCSQFESGNLRKAIQIREFEYDLILSSDINTNSHHQWFYFEMSNMSADTTYKFNIINCEKLNSQFNAGMKPVMFSLKQALTGRPFWFRTGFNICYYKNCYTRSRTKSYFTASFQIRFPHDDDICYLAYHFPYTYSTLMTHLKNWEDTHDEKQIYFKNDSLCETLSGNTVPLVTVTAPSTTLDEQLKSYSSTAIQDRRYVFLSARVHPGESNSSWVMKGIIDFLMSNRASAIELREKYVFKIIPMLNPDGVINGNHRCSLSGNDLNRRWMTPCPKIHPTIFHTKGLLLYMKSINKVPILYCDLHGHSQKKNIFIYGCSSLHSWKVCDNDNPVYRENGEDTTYKILPFILDQVAPAFSLPDTRYQVEKMKEGTARVIVWREVGVINSYCMESTYCGFDQGIYRNCHVSTHHLHEMGHRFCEAVVQMTSIPSLESDGSASTVSTNPSSLSLSNELIGKASSSETLELSSNSNILLNKQSKRVECEREHHYLLEENSEDDEEEEEEEEDEDDDDDDGYEDEALVSSGDESLQHGEASGCGDGKAVCKSTRPSRNYEIDF